MSHLVLDSSMTMAWCFEDETTPLSEAALDVLEQHKAVVPALWPFEVANSLITAERKGRVTTAKSLAFVATLDEPLRRAATAAGVSLFTGQNPR